MPDKQEIESKFQRDIAEHKLTILRNDGIYRHVRCAKPGTGVYGFEIITWPGWLCYTGDMGSYTFRRIEDMFEFFRTKPHLADKDRLWINPGYWAEKVQAADRHGEVFEFSSERFENRLREYIAAIDRDNAEALSEAFEEEVIGRYDSSDEREAREAAEAFTFEGEKVFKDLWDMDFREHTHHFLWCCYAIAWAVREFDRQTAEPLPAAA